jgi:hypothetical protein
VIVQGLVEVSWELTYGHIVHSYWEESVSGMGMTKA